MVLPYPRIYLHRFLRVRSTSPLPKFKWYAQDGFVGFYGNIYGNYILTIGVVW